MNVVCTITSGSSTGEELRGILGAKPYSVHSEYSHASKKLLDWEPELEEKSMYK